MVVCNCWCFWHVQWRNSFFQPLTASNSSTSLNNESQFFNITYHDIIVVKTVSDYYPKPINYWIFKLLHKSSSISGTWKNGVMLLHRNYCVTKLWSTHFAILTSCLWPCFLYEIIFQSSTFAHIWKAYQLSDIK